MKKSVSFFDPQPERTQVWKCGGGTQSAAIAVLIADGRLPRPDIALMVDTGRENSNTFPYVSKWIVPAMRSVGVELSVIRKADFTNVDVFGGKDGNTILLPGFTDQAGRVGKLQNFCSGEWKRDAMSRWLRTQGVKQCDSWIGFSLDEMGRVFRARRQWDRPLFPLIELLVRRQACVEIVRGAGWDDPPRSSCWMCPNKGDDEWLDMKVNRPRDFAKAVKFERGVRNRDPHFWLHQSCRPLDQVPFTKLPLLWEEQGCGSGMCGV